MQKYFQTLFSEEKEAECLKFLGSDNKFLLTNAQNIVNQFQNENGKILIFDTRPSYYYHKTHFINAVNIPVDQYDDEIFLKWDPQKIADTILNNETRKELFAQRKRIFVYIIVSQHEIQNYLDKFPKVFCRQAVNDYFSKHQEEKGKLFNLLSLRRGILLYKALRNEKIREVFLCVNGQATFKHKYPQFCKFRTSFLYPRSIQSQSYPNEILEGRLYLGNHSHAQDRAILQNLKITHILNVSHNIPNYFEDHFDNNVEYLRINVEDNSQVPIKLSFAVAYNFIEDAFSEFKLLTIDKSARDNGLIDESCKSYQQIHKQNKERVISTALLSPLKVDFINSTQERQSTSKDQIEFQISNLVDAFNRVAYNKNVVLVHCAMGVSRSAACVIMYIMKKFRIGYDDALEYVQSRRNVVDPNEGFVQQLKEFQQHDFEFYSEKHVIVNQQTIEQLFTEEENSPTTQREFSKIKMLFKCKSSLI